jgi:hypothetical protein
VFAAYHLADLLAGRGDVEGLRQLADAGDGLVAYRLAKLLAERGDHNELRLEVLRGNDGARGLLIDLMAIGDSAAAERLRRSGLNIDGTMP